MAEGLLGNEKPDALRQDRGYCQEWSDSGHGDRRYRKNPEVSHVRGGEVNADVPPQSLGTRQTESRGRGRGAKRRTDLDWRLPNRYELGYPE